MANWIDVSISQHQLKLFDSDKILIKAYPIATRKILPPNSEGIFIIINKQSNPSAPHGILWMGLSKPYYGIHGSNNPDSIGKNLFRLELSSSAPIGTKVYIHK